MKYITQLPRWATWGLIIPLIVLNGWAFLVVFHYFQSLIAILVAANLLAFILNYPVSFLASHGVKRSRAVLWVVSLALLLVVVLGLTLVPLAIEQLYELSDRLPSWIESGRQQLQALNDIAIARNFPIDVSGLATQLTERLSVQLQSLTGEVLGVLLGTVGRVLDVILTLVLTFYLLLHSKQLWDGLGEWLPQPLGDRLRTSLRQSFHNYFIGQSSLAAIIGVSMTVAFVILKVPFGLLFGLGVGLMALFPFGAGLSICIVSFLMALTSFWLGVKVLVVTVIIEQVIENGIAPRLLGGFTGLNPVWVLVSLLIGAKVGGVLGLLIAVPIAGFIKSTALILRKDSLTLSSPQVLTPASSEV